MDRLSAIFQFAPLRLTLAISWSLLLSLLLLQAEADPVIDLGIPRGENTLARELVFSAVHLLAFGGTCICWNWALPQTLGARKTLLVACAITIVLGVSTELLQTFTPDRHASWLDLAANIAGAVIAARLLWTRRIWR